jgi:hypothetical protein
LNFSGRSAAVPRTSGNTQFFSHQRAAAPQRIPFAQQQRAMSGGAVPRSSAPSGASVERGGFGSQGNARSQAVAGPQNAPRSQANPVTGNAGGWRTFGGPSGAPRNEAPPAATRPNPALQNTRPPSAGSAQQAPQSRGGWQRFGEPGGAPRQRQQSAPQQAPQPSRPQAAPKSNFQGGSGFGAPRYSAPSSGRERSGGSAPRSNSAPPSRGGGGGGGHQSGGGGGHSSGGGHGRH